MTNIPTPAVTDYQVLTFIVDRRLRENNSLNNSRFWLKEYHVRGTEIATRYGVTLDDLVDAWASWTLEVRENRESQKAGA
jgi:hypothetical protein